MKEFSNVINKKLYYQTIFIIQILMLIGLFVNNPYLEGFQLEFYIHSFLVIFLSICLWLYPNHEHSLFRMVIIIVTALYIYILFFIYPDTWTTFIFICLMPAISILFFDSRLFYFSFILNGIMLTATFLYVFFMDKKNVFYHLKLDTTGTIINFIASQAIIYFIYYLSYVRLKKMQGYYKKIQEAERLKTTGQLAAGVAHEIRNPMTVVKGFLQLYEKDSTITDDVKKHFKLMISELNTAEEVLTQFLSIAKPNKSEKIQQVNVKEILQMETELLSSYGHYHNNKVILDVKENCYIFINQIEFKQLVVNLIKNAIEASHPGDPVLVSAEEKKGFVKITIIDHGNGMSPDELKALGTPFYSLKSKGTGLGLMVCFNIVESYNGTIHFNSSVGNGTTVTVLFPAKK